jgi:hypothetical protein
MSPEISAFVSAPNMVMTPARTQTAQQQGGSAEFRGHHTPGFAENSGTNDTAHDHHGCGKDAEARGAGRRRRFLCVAMRCNYSSEVGKQRKKSRRLLEGRVLILNVTRHERR